MSFLTSAPLWIAVVLVAGGGTLVAVVAALAIGSRDWLDRLVRDNDIAGFKFATIGVLYAVLLAFTVIVVWEQMNDADRDIAAEAEAAAALFRLSGGMDAEPAAAVRQALAGYLETAIRDDWPAMAEGAGSPAAVTALTGVYQAVLGFDPADPRGAVVLAEMLRQLDRLANARRDRVFLADGIVPDVVWLALFAGAAMTIGFTLFFGVENVRAQALMTGALALLIALGLLIIIAIDRPFSGTIRLEPDSLVRVLDDFAGS